MADLVIYTAITSGKDALHEPAHVLPGVSYVCFTDTPGLTSNVYEIRPLPFTEANPRLTARKIKLLAPELFPEHAASLWLDGSKRIRRDLTPLLAELSGASFSLMAHPQRNCLYDEIEACARLGRDDPDMLAMQAAHYHMSGMPQQAGLFETSVLYRRHTPAIASLMQAWWQELQTHSARDQASLPYVLYREDAMVQALDYRLWHDPYFTQYPHNWNPPGDQRNALSAKLHNALWRQLQNFGLQTPYEQAMQRVKHLLQKLLP